MLEEYADSNKVHLWILAAVKDGMPVLGPKIVRSGLWSVRRVKGRPYRY